MTFVLDHSDLARIALRSMSQASTALRCRWDLVAKEQERISGQLAVIEDDSTPAS